MPTHFEILVEEPSMEAFLGTLLPKLLTRGQTFRLLVFQGKQDLLSKLESRLRSYAEWIPEHSRIVVLVDRDEQDCLALKATMEGIAARAGLRSKSGAKGERWQLVNRIVIEELEAWYFGDWEAVRAVYPRAKADVPRRSAFREPDAIAGGTWEVFERTMQRYGYFKGGLTKIEAARRIAGEIDPVRNTSPSFRALMEALASGSDEC